MRTRTRIEQLEKVGLIQRSSEYIAVWGDVDDPGPFVAEWIDEEEPRRYEIRNPRK